MYLQDFSQTYRNTRSNKHAYRLWNNARQRAKVKSREFTITQQWVEEQLSFGRCAVTGIQFDLSFNRLWSPSLDRKDSALGYTPENTQMVVFIYNSAKLTGSHEDVLKMSRALIAANDK